MTTSNRPPAPPRPRRRPSGDDGFTLLAAIAVASICLMLATAVVAMAIGGNRASGVDRNRTQATAAAEGGIDTALSVLRALDPSTQAGLLTSGCQQAIAPAATAPGLTVTLRYAFYLTASGGSAVTCPLQNGKGYKRVEVTSTARQVTGSIDRSATETAVVVLQAPSLFRHAVFTGGSLSASRLTTTGAGLYASGSASCDTGSSLGGGTTVLGSFAMYNGCSVAGDLLVGGSWSCDNGRVTGSAVVGGSVGMYNACRVDGSLTSGGTVSGSNVGGTRTSNSPTAGTTVAAGARTMPALDYQPAEWSTAPAQSLASLGASGCSLNYVTHAVSASVPLVIDARSCSPLTFDTLTLTTNTDITVFANGFSGQNNLVVTSSDGKPHSFRLIVPASSATGNPCTAGGAAIALSGTPTDPLISTFLYTPGPLVLYRDTTLRGAAYSCSTSFSGQTRIDYTAAALPPRVGGGLYTLLSARRAGAIG